MIGRGGGQRCKANVKRRVPAVCDEIDQGLLSRVRLLENNVYPDVQPLARRLLASKVW